MNKILKTLLWPLVKVKQAYENYLCRTNPEKLFCMRYKRVTGYKLNIDNPKTLYDKIAYLAFRTDTTKWSLLADKVGVRDYVAAHGYGENLPKLYGTWDDASKIDYSVLPDSFVIKTNNASATNIIVKDKSKLDIKATNKQLNKWLAIDYGLRTCQPHYSKIKPLILAEELLIDYETTKKGKSLNDYKFFCVNGKAYYVMAMTDRTTNSHDFKVTVFDLDWTPHPELQSGYHEMNATLKKPTSFDTMIKIAEILAKDFEFVRVDFYDINGVPILGELTFTPGWSTASKELYDILGEKMTINRNE